MKLSKYPLKTWRDDPQGETSVNARLLWRAGYIDKLMSGVYSYHPIGCRVLKNIEKIVREEMDNIGAHEIRMPALHPSAPWKITGRWEVEEMMKTEKYGLGWTHEEIVTPLAQKIVNSEKDLPLYLYQIQMKFRNEPRAKSGLLRGREFVMKDMYAFHLSEQELDDFYEEVKQAYMRIFNRLGIGDDTYLTLASGGAFSNENSHEFQTASPYGEDNTFVCPACRLGVNAELNLKECPQCGSKDLQDIKTIETANIFKLSDRYSSAFDFKVNGQKVYMACYGLGITRAMGAIVEVLSDDRGLVWPTSIAPFPVYLIDIDAPKEAEQLCQELDLLYDDRDKSVGEKFNDADLLGIPYRLVVSHRNPGMVEVKKRTETEGQLMKISEAIKYVQENIK
jgi:prolyl-tRNA synthetase